MGKKRARTEYGERVYKARTQAKLTQHQLAEAAGMSQGTLGELEYDALKSRYTAHIAAACGVRAEWLATGEGPMLDGGLLPDVAQLARQMNQLQGKGRQLAIEALTLAISHAHMLERDATEEPTKPDPKQEPSPEGARKLR